MFTVVEIVKHLTSFSGLLSGCIFIYLFIYFVFQDISKISQPDLNSFRTYTININNLF